ncbi:MULTISPECIES: flagellar hook length control protein FliK [Enterobacter]|jgi:flagellar hook-length control protein FliK|uniref:Flagellar hook length control protein FliK n=1 Tax=Enterobacter rongchengensis TaxID=3030999 RepID=A0ABV4JGS9_9ENTR|nr:MULTISPECIES: flagellar hook length control protein FliK [Enterobacter]PNL51439.1 flagellar hook length control protein FliK [Enterobacter hormaechei]HCR0842566.1 flagellar hook length control protein FliK [Enterobacter cancerogenus]EKX4011500.1 flagellar hook length control protein FliK [Enterobacter cloacae]ELV3043644.1 flagellar hook length control protein FliK [Enterobacter chengduensis]KJM01236.1 flagellar hook-length control protein [Enterobacter chengduensis]
MITLQQLLMSDSDLSGGTQTGKGADGAQDFLSLLAGALSDATGKGKDAPLTLADLKAAGSKLSKVAQDAKGDTALQAKIADLLARQPALSGDETAQLTAPETLMSGLVPLSKGDAVKTLTAANGKDDGKSELTEEELAGLSALMAMLPHQQTSTAHAAGSDGIAARSALGSATLAQRGASQLPLNAPAGSHDKGQTAVPYQSQVKTSGPDLTANAPAAPVVPAAAEKQELASSSSTASPTATPAPILSSHATSQPAATVATAPVLSQPLGTHEWQQSLSQHITLFTKQGQQTAELRLHPEDLGQVQISLKLDDNQAQLQMVSAHSHVRAALEAALPVLRTSLAENGIQLAQSSVSSESFAGQQHSSFQQQHQASRSGNTGGFNEESDELLPVPAALQSAARGNGAVDIFA